MSHRSPGLVLAVALLAAAGPLASQQPARHWEPRGFDFSPDGAWRRRAREVRVRREAALARRDMGLLNAPLDGPRALLMAPAAAPQPSPLAVTGVLRVPVFLVSYRNTDPLTLRSPAEYDEALFSATPPPGRPFTVASYYRELSNDLLQLQGQVLGWTALDSNDTWYEGGCSGLCSGGHVPQLILEAVRRTDASVDFGQFDNDGPDLVPNSGDDDGIVDVAVFVQPEVGGECRALVPSSAANIWSHRAWYSFWAGSPIATDDPRRDAGGNPIPGQFIAVDDYTIQPAVGGSTSCDGSQILPPGTIAHETGHALGLPDLYDTYAYDGDDSEGIGNWGLMGSGGYASSLSPAHMVGFSRLLLGWVTVVDVNGDATVSLGPYAAADTIVRIVPAGSNPRNEYFLIENRQGVLGDSALVRMKGPGLLVYHVDGQQYQAGRFLNDVNSGPIHGVWLLQADGLDQLRSSTPGVRNRGDAGDPFPGTSGNTALGFATNPSNLLNTGAFPGFIIDSIATLAPGGAMRLRVRFPGALAAADTVLRAPVMGAPYSDTLVVVGGTGQYQFALVSGSLPPGLALSPQGVIAGIPTSDSAYAFAVLASSGGSAIGLPLRLAVSAPRLAAAAVVNQLLRGGTLLTADEQRYLDLAGNLNGGFDIGDVQAWIDRNPGLVTSADVRRLLLGAGR